MTSASTACCTGMIMPAPKPAMALMSSRTASPLMKPMMPVNRPLMARPMSSSGRRPTRSDRRPENCSAMTLPTAKAVSAKPATAAPCWNVAAANSGTMATRTPKLVQPFAKADMSTER